MLQVQILSGNVSALPEAPMSYPSFDEWTKQLTDNQSVTYQIKKGNKILYEGIYRGIGQIGAHYTLIQKLEQAIQNQTISPRKGRKFLKQLDRSFIEDMKHLHPSKRQSFRWKKISKHYLILTGCFSLVFLISYASYYLIHNHMVETKPSYEELLKKNEYLQAASLYPDKLEQIEWLISENQDISNLKKFQKKYPTIQGDFDLTFYQKKWQKVVSFQSIELDTQRQIKLAFAYIRLDRIEEAEIVAKHLSSKALNKEIRKGWIRRAIYQLQKAQINQAEQIQAKINDSTLQEWINAAKICQEMIQYSEEKKDQTSLNLWKQRLTTIGKEYLHEMEK
ncbi:hypothetical protein [uncultured Enterococcus sp.]|uniref:hypothetical protein n=1 Tax=uncultured Enterococcus sp. TaxID=167972 RepID=UPI00261DDB4F|nr:hypothetical protein [uncultured Enterococcus sp.]